MCVEFQVCGSENSFVAFLDKT